MVWSDLREFIEALDQAGELLKIGAPVSCHLEIAEIADRVSKGKPEDNKALLFTSVTGYDMPVLINTFGSMKRMCMALNVENLDEVAARIKQFIKPKVPENIVEKLALLPRLLELGRFPRWRDPRLAFRLARP